jgi:hypothetical protein
MEQVTDIEVELRQFVREIDGCRSHAQMIQHPGTAGICLRIERLIEDVADPAPHALEICRATVARAAESARKHIFPRT